MTAKSLLLRPQGLRPRTRAPTCPLCYATAGGSNNEGVWERSPAAGD